MSTVKDRLLKRLVERPTGCGLSDRLITYLETWHARQVDAAMAWAPLPRMDCTVERVFPDEAADPPSRPVSEQQRNWGLNYPADQMGNPLETPGNPPSSPLGAMKDDLGTTSYVGVIQPAGEANECAHTALSLIYRRERDEARATIKRLEELSLTQFHEWDRLYATIERRTNVAVQLEGICAEQEDQIGRLAQQLARTHIRSERLAADLLARDATVDRLWVQLNEASSLPSVRPPCCHGCDTDHEAVDAYIDANLPGVQTAFDRRSL